MKLWAEFARMAALRNVMSLQKVWLITHRDL